MIPPQFLMCDLACLIELAIKRISSKDSHVIFEGDLRGEGLKILGELMKHLRMSSWKEKDILSKNFHVYIVSRFLS